MQALSKFKIDMADVLDDAAWQIRSPKLHRWPLVEAMRSEQREKTKVTCTKKAGGSGKPPRVALNLTESNIQAFNYFGQSPDQNFGNQLVTW